MRKIKVLALVLVFAFAALGGAYAMWYDSLFVDANVNTGTVDLQWECGKWAGSDKGDNYEGQWFGSVYFGSRDRLDAGNPNDRKNVGATNAEITADTEDVEATADKDLLTITVKNAYPGYQEWISATILNCGTVPAKCELLGTDSIPAWLHLRIVTNDCAQTVLYDSKTGVNKLGKKQIDPNKTLGVKFIGRVLQEAPQKTDTSFSLQLKGIQWNEYGFSLPNEVQ